jgi:hypothetical protein
VENLGTASGALYTSASVGSLLGAPLAGLIIGAGGRYLLMSVAVLAVPSLRTFGQLRLPEAHPFEELVAPGPCADGQGSP